MKKISMLLMTILVIFFVSCKQQSKHAKDMNPFLMQYNTPFNVPPFDKIKNERIWTIDIMHIKNESLYAGVIERVTEKISSVLTEKMKQTILKIKWESERHKEKIFGIDIYQAVIEENIDTFQDFQIWKQNKKDVGISLWEPCVEIKQ
jgi:hypothetical protein